jgi:hypothetical protein
VRWRAHRRDRYRSHINSYAHTSSNRALGVAGCGGEATQSIVGGHVTVDGAAHDWGRASRSTGRMSLVYHAPRAVEARDLLLAPRGAPGGRGWDSQHSPLVDLPSNISKSRRRARAHPAAEGLLPRYDARLRIASSPRGSHRVHAVRFARIVVGFDSPTAACVSESFSPNSFLKAPQRSVQYCEPLFVPIFEAKNGCPTRARYSASRRVVARLSASSRWR